MRIFVHNVDTFLGQALVKELRRDERGLNRIFGSTLSGKAPSTVKKIFSRDDPKKAQKFKEKLQSVKVVIMDLFSCTLEDLHFAINALKVDIKATPPKITGELEQDVVFILISSVMVWADTRPEKAAAAPAEPAPDAAEGEGDAAAAEPPAEGEAEEAAVEEEEAPAPAPAPAAEGPDELLEAHYERRRPRWGAALAPDRAAAPARPTLLRTLWKLPHLC